MLTRLVDAHPVEARFVAEAHVGPCRPTAVAHALVENEIEGFGVRPLPVGQGIGVGALHRGAGHFSVDAPCDLGRCPLDGEGVVARIVDVAHRKVRHGVVFVLEVERPIGVQGVIGLVFVVDLLPNVDFSLVRPTFFAFGGHHPEGGEVAAVGGGEDTRLGSTVTEGVAAFTSHSAGDEVLLFALCLEGIGRGHGAAHQFTVLHEDREGRIGVEAGPGGIAANGARPDFGVGLRTVGGIELVGEGGQIFCVLAGHIVGDDAHIALHDCGGKGDSAVGGGDELGFGPLRRAAHDGGTVEFAAVAHGEALEFIAGIGGDDAQGEGFVGSHGEGQCPVGGIEIGVARIETQAGFGVGFALDFEPGVDDGAAIGEYAVFALGAVFRPE